MKEAERNLDPLGQSRRKWMVTSAAAVAGTMAACGSSSSDGDNLNDPSCFPGDAPAGDLPAPDAARCTDQIDTPAPAPDEQRFSAWNTALRARAGGRESAFTDLDAIDNNLKLVGDTLGSDIALRFVAKSLPCPQLLEYMMVAACTNRVMAFSEGMTRDLLCRFGSDIDILLGRPAPVDAARRTFDTLEGRFSGPNPAAGVRWLVDTAVRMEEYGALAEERGEEINISVEIDVGLRRGGARDDQELLAMMAVIDQSPLLRFTGFMGYDGQVPFAPTSDPTRELLAVQERYGQFVDAARDAYPAMFEGPLVFNSGGSRTYHYYTDELDTVVNEVAMGSAFFYPSNFSNIPEKRLRRASFLASPVLKRIDPAEAPFAPGYLPRLAEENPDYEVQFVLVAGSFPGDVVQPEGLVPNPVTSSVEGEQTGGVVNLLPNQAEWLGARALPLEVGDFVFYHPWEGDAVRWLRRLDVFRGEELVDQWPTFEPGIRLT